MTPEVDPDRVSQQQDDKTLVAAWPRASEEEGRSRPTVDTTTSQLGAERTDGKYDEATISSVTPQRLCVCVLAVLLCLK